MYINPNLTLQIPYDEYTEKIMRAFYNSLNEKDKRHYAALEALKLDYGGISYISQLLCCHRNTIKSGIDEFKKDEFLPPDTIRNQGGGRQKTIQKNKEVEEVFLKVVSDHIAGDPENEKIRWLKLTRDEVSERMKAQGVTVSRNIVKQLMKKHRLVKRKMQRKRSTGKSVHREEQFNNIIAEKENFTSTVNPIISIDTKKKELVGGNLHREGEVYCTEPIESSDHDYPHLADVKIVPHGIYDMKQNKAYINIGISSETAEFICDSLQNWWLNYGKKEYPNADTILIFCDAGGANSYRHHIFKIELQKLSNTINMKLKIVHYPPYTSKWNPIEHRVFPHVTRSLSGVPLNTIDEAKEKIGLSKTKTGLTVVVDIISKTYQLGKQVAKDFMDSIKIKCEKSLPQFNYTIFPTDCMVS